MSRMFVPGVYTLRTSAGAVRARAEFTVAPGENEPIEVTLTRESR